MDYSKYEGSDITAEYAAKLCSDLVYNGFDDWFLPSQDELELMCVNLHMAGLGGFSKLDTYWSSSEYHFSANTAWSQNFLIGSWNDRSRSYDLRVLPVRAF